MLLVQPIFSRANIAVVNFGVTKGKKIVIPAKAGIQVSAYQPISIALDSRLRGNDVHRLKHLLEFRHSLSFDMG